MLQKILSTSLMLLCSMCVFTSSNLQAGEFTLKKTDDGNIDVQLDGKHFTTYLTDEGTKPYLWPIKGSGGEDLTRAFPMKKIEGERHDHPHHRSLWFTHGNVNGVDFWGEKGSCGKTVHQEYLKTEDGKTAVISTLNDWIGPDRKKICEDERTLTFSVDPNQPTTRIIDFDITVKATEGDVKFGDTKEGTMGVRVPTSLDVDSKQGGTIVTSEGKKDGATWGTQAAWVDYSGPVKDKTVGVAILNHPSSFRYPTYWHVRTYGLFAANPFGLHDFQKPKKVDGSHTIKKGETMTLRYRIVFHEGDVEEAKIADAFETYSKVKK